MSHWFDEQAWAEAITHDDWYVRLYPKLQRLRSQWEREPNEREATEAKRAVRSFFERAYETNQLKIGTTGINLDKERLPIDTMVIHHTSSRPGYTIPRMNATQLLNIYVPHFNNPPPNEKELKGMPIWSNHVQGGRPVFYVYHWLMRMDGSFERLLADEELGWHAANWNINRRSVAICLDNDYETNDPDPAVIEKLGAFIGVQYPYIALERIFGHSEVSQHKTSCPGSNFVHGWKQSLVGAMRP